MAEETKDVTVGPMPFDDFLSQFLPSPRKIPAGTWFCAKSAEFRNLGKRDDESKFVSTLYSLTYRSYDLRHKCFVDFRCREDRTLHEAEIRQYDDSS